MTEEQELESFEFALDRKVTTWKRTTFTVQATSLDEAKRMVKDDGWGCIHDEDHYFEEEIEFSEEDVSPEENDGQATEIWSCIDNGDWVSDNSIKKGENV